jgi:uncharacterized delta-60 repeat protein
MHIQSDGKILIGGDFFGGNPWMQFEIVRLNQDGSPDSSFGTAGNGVVTTSFVPPGFNSYNRFAAFLTDFTIQDDGKIVAVGYIYPYGGSPVVRYGSWAIARYNVNVPGQTDGSLDTTFGDSGTIYSGFDSYVYNVYGGYPPWFPASATGSDALVYPTSVVAQNDKLLITYGDGHLARLNQTDGSLDTMFGDGGLLANSNIATLIALQGNAIIGVNDGDALTVSRLYADGHGPELVSTSSVVAAPATSVFGQSATFTGTVQFQVDGAAFGAPVVVNQGTASMTTATLPAGTHTVAALYSGDDQFTGSAASTSFVVNPLTASNLQAALSAPQQGDAVTLQMTSNSDVSTAVAAVNDLGGPGAGATETITLDLGGGTYTTDTQVSTQPGVTLVIVNGTLIGGSPALIVDAGNVILEHVTALNATNAPTILVNGGLLIVRDSTIEESSGYTQTALWINGGSVDLGTAADPGHNTINVNGTGELVHNASGIPLSAVEDTFTINGVSLAPSSLSGIVFSDFNDDGQVDFGEQGIAGVTINLGGTDFLGNPVHTSLATDSDGAYVFQNLLPGTYTITETQPAGYTQGINTVGTGGGTVSGDQFTVNLAGGIDALNYNFGEQPAATGAIQHGQTAGIGFWNNKNGQALIKALNGGGTSTQLGDWLAATFPHMFGALSGSNDLAGQNNATVASFFQSRFVVKEQKLDAQVLATALAVYVTDGTLDNTGVGTQYGFVVGGNGVATATVNVGSNGAAFGVADNTTMTVMDLLLAADAQAVNGVLYNGNATKRSMANSVFSAINQAGAIN